MKLTKSASKHCFEVVDETVDRTDEVSNHTHEVSSKHSFEVVDKTDEVSNLYTAR
ncbi:chlorohydrolase [Streptococcus pneumoniae]|uniref:hypothetical protein n=1 Tax=Streptococcus pneumoniae TaxID=1313 RepID=UPI000B74B2A3|nr:hypothetical protein [Streptococcus pneumoniae]SNJ99976.1 chlorohydrolase [Streptococcus pneumoniae]